MRFSSSVWAFVMIGLVGVEFPDAKADPCGMVPPIDWAAQTPIQRIGAQKTYVFFRGGLETIVLRPGFSGKVDEFGMLIPFPSPPAIRKVPDNVFEQIAAAIDPPEVVIDLRWQEGMYGGAGFGGGFGGGGGGFGGGLGFQLPKDEVRVIREEAVGMYEVAVLAAGSDKALKRWMEDHKFVYPSGMEAVCPEYIEQRWCFVAVKTKVNQKDAADPQPGQRAIDNALPEGATFDGYVQAMGFRFHTPELVVPMRLSVHNSGELRNVVYLLTDTPSKIRNLPEEFVRRQVSGFKLFDQLTKPLPLRVLGGTVNDIPRATLRGLARRRDPEPHNGVAAELFASDLIASRTRQLESQSEAYEKHLFTINEALELRGPEIDEAVRRQIRVTRAHVVHAALKAIEKMTMTVIDGDFPRDVLARENLTFAEFHMPFERSNRSFYDANKLGRAKPSVGELYVDDLIALDVPTSASQIPIASEVVSSPTQQSRSSWLPLLIAMIVTGGLAAWRFPNGRRVVSVALVLLILGATSLLAIGDEDDKVPSLNVLVRRLGNPETAELASEQIVKLGEDAVPAMIAQSRSSNLVTQGWAIVSLGRIGGKDAMRHLSSVHSHESVSPLVQSWAAAAMVQAAGSTEELEKLSALVSGRPELVRPFLLAFRRLLREDESGEAVQKLLALGVRVPALKPGIVIALSTDSAQSSVGKFLQLRSLHSLVGLANEYPQLATTIAAEVRRQIETTRGVNSSEVQLIAASRSSTLAQALSSEILAEGSQPLLHAMLKSDDSEVRRTAAGYLATLGLSADALQAIASDIAVALAFTSTATKSPWEGGALFIPNINWQEAEAHQLVDNLIRWHLWADRNKETDMQRQITNNLNSVTLAQAAKYQITAYSHTEAWLKSWKRVVGAKAMRELLAQQEAEDDYPELLLD